MYRRALRLYSLNGCLATKACDAGDDNTDAPHNSRFAYHTPREGQQYYSTQLFVKRNYERRRASGGGRHKMVIVIRELLMEDF